MLLRTTILCLAAISGFGQVHSLTLGLDVNSPYGLSEPWFTIRNGLLRCEDIETVAERPDLKSAVAQVTPRDGRLPDFEKLQRALSESGAGASLRGVEATVEGELAVINGKPLLRIGEREIPLRPLTELV